MIVRLVLGLALISLAPGCAHTATPGPGAVPLRLVLVPSEQLGPDMLLQQRLYGRYGEQQVELRCVLQLSQHELTIIGLTPFGSRAFLLSQKGRVHTFTQYVDRELPFDPVHILDDVHRVFFRGLTSGQGEVRTAVEAGETVTEHWVSGVLTDRTFERLDHNPAGVIRVSFSGAPAPLVSPHVVIDNGWYGYRVEIDNLVQQSLP